MGDLPGISKGVLAYGVDESGEPRAVRASDDGSLNTRSIGDGSLVDTLTYVNPGVGESAKQTITLAESMPGTGQSVANIDNPTNQAVTVKFYNIEGEDHFYLTEVAVAAGARISQPVQAFCANGHTGSVSVTPAAAATGTVTIYIRAL